MNKIFFVWQITIIIVSEHFFFILISYCCCSSLLLSGTRALRSDCQVRGTQHFVSGVREPAGTAVLTSNNSVTEIRTTKST